MAKELGIEAIQTRKREIAAEIDKLTRESDELDTALRVFQRFAAPPEPETKLGPARPEGIPSLFIMASTVIREREDAGKRGPTARELVEEMARRWWPGLQAQQVLPSVYRFAKQGRIRKSPDGRFHSPRKSEAPPSLLEGASENGEAQASST